MKFESKITWTILSLIIFFGILASLTTFFLTRNEFTTQASSTLNQNLISHSHEVYQIFRQSHDLSIMLAERQDIRDYFTYSTPLSVNFLTGYNLGDMYSAIYLLDSNGTCRLSTDPRFITQDYSFRNYFKEALSGQSFTTAALGVTSGELGYYFSAPIYSLKDEDLVVGVVVFKLKPNYIDDALLQHVSDGYNIMLTDQYGIVILSSDKTKLFNSLGTLPESFRTILNENKTYGTSDFPKLDYDKLQNEIVNKNDTSSPRLSKIQDERDNDDEIVSISKIKDFPFHLVFEGDLSKITAFSLQSTLVIAGFVALTALASIFVITSIIKQLIKSQEQIEHQILLKNNDLEKLNRLMVGRELKMLELKKQLSEKT